MYIFSNKITFLCLYWIYTSSFTTANSVLDSSVDEAAIISGDDDDNFKKIILSSTNCKTSKVDETTESFKNVAYTIFKCPEKTWIGSVQYCSQIGGSLVDILTEQEHDFILLLIKNARISTDISPWTGGQDINSEGNFKWIRTEGKVNETFFANRTDIKMNMAENCLAFGHYTETRFKLSPKLHCKKARPFICKFIRSS